MLPQGCGDGGEGPTVRFVELLPGQVEVLVRCAGSLPEHGVLPAGEGPGATGTLYKFAGRKANKEVKRCT